MIKLPSDNAVIVDPVSDTREMLPLIQCDEAVLEGYKMMVAERVLASGE